MVKHLLLFAVGALALNACTSEDVIDDVATSRSLISFENVVNKPSRAPEIDSKNFRNFNVFGFYTMPENSKVANEVFTNVAVKYNTEGGNVGTWTYDEQFNRYWVKDAKYYFYAYSCGNIEKLGEDYGKFLLDMSGEKDASARKLEIKGYVCDDSHQHDLVCASNTGGDDFEGIVGKDKANSAVALQFSHVLAKLKARFTTTFPKEYEVRISDVCIRNIRSTGDYVFGDGWNATTIGGNEGDKEPSVNLYLKNAAGDTVKYLSVWNKKVGESQTQQSVDTESAFAIPFDYFTTNGGDEATEKEVYIRFIVDVYYGNEHVMTKTLTGSFNPIWQEGYSYVYNVEINGSTTNMEVISFTTANDAAGGAVLNWNSGETPKIETNK